MKVAIHKIHWPGKWTTSGDDIDIEILDVDCFVKKVSHPCAKWAIGEAWIRVSSWYQKKHAKVTLGETREVENLRQVKFN